MPFEKVATQIDLPTQERAILEFWQEIEAFETLCARNRGKAKWSFLDGPITANNPMGVHHAWGRTYKDVYQRYFAMTGHEERYQNGFDCQGLWVEVEVEKELGLKTKRDIENLVPGDRFASIDKFVQLCKQRVDKYAQVQTEQSIRLGYWMDWDREEDWAKPPDQRRSYFTMSEENNYTIWTFLKKCHERGLVYRGYDAMPWCPRCAVGLSQMEMHEGYRLVAHRALFVAFPLRGRPGENLLVWTTTPWTLTSNVAAAVNPYLTYLKVKLREQIYYLARGAFTAARREEEFKRKEWVEGVPKLKTLEQIFKEKAGKEGFQVLGELKGEAMLGWPYDGPFDELSAQQHPGGYPAELAHVVLQQNWAPATSARDVHRVVAWEIVGETEGTGIVHIAPGCGKEDFQLGRELHEWSIFKELVATKRLKIVQNEVQLSAEDEGIRGVFKGRDVLFPKLQSGSGPIPFRGSLSVQLDVDTPDAKFYTEFYSCRPKNAEGLPPVAPLDDSGVFLPGFGDLEGKSAVDHETTDWILNNLQQKGVLLAVEKYPHSYPHCWRCKTELLFRLIDEWFINMSWREEIMRATEQVKFLPESINGQARELDWLKNMGDWMISKKRYWGLALPIWVCEKCGQFDVIGGREELKKRAVAGWEQFEGHSPHRPWIDQVKVRCEKCQGTMSRIPDVGNPWLDAGIVPYSTMGYNRDRKYWETWFPADFITESFPGQFRNWFYAILAMSTMMTRRAPMKVLLGHGQVRDQKGEEMHKSKGNAIPFDGATDTGYKLFHERDPKLKPEAQAHRDLPEGWVEGSVKEESILLENRPKSVVSAMYPPMGADEIRWLYCRHNPANNINFGPGPAEELRSKFLLKLWNTYAFFVNYARLDEFDPSAKPVPVKERPDIDRWILSDLQLLIRKAREAFESYNVMAFCLEAEKFVDDKLSNWYVRRNRRRFWKSEKGADKQAAYQTLYTVLTTLVKLMAPVMPFLSETMWQNLGARSVSEGAANPSLTLRAPKESVHLWDYPEVDDALIDADLSEDMDSLLHLVSVGSAARNNAKIKVRQPLARMQIEGEERYRRAVERFNHQICEELNIKEVSFYVPTDGHLLTSLAKPNVQVLGKRFGPKLPEVLKTIQKYDPAELARIVRSEKLLLECPNGNVWVFPSDFLIEPQAPEGWVGAFDSGIMVRIDVRVTDALKGEGYVREITRHVQQLRKEAGLEMEDRITLSLQTDAAALKKAIETHKEYICNETLAVQFTTEPLGERAHRAEVKVEGQALVIELRKV